MNCHKALQVLYLYREGELSPRIRAALDKHCMTCSSCAREVRRIDLLKQGTESLRDMELPGSEGLVQDVLAALRSPERGPTLRHSTPSRGWQFAIAAAFSAIALLPVGQNIVDAGRIASLESRLIRAEGLHENGKTADLAFWAGLGEMASQNTPVDPVVQKELWSLVGHAPSVPFEDGARVMREEILRRTPLLQALARGKLMSPAEQRRARSELLTLLNTMR
jgi:hypothetical protein